MAHRATSPKIVPLTPARWRDFERLFGPRGACAGCWCMTSRLPRREYDAGKGERNRRAMKKLVDARRETGLLAYLDGAPVGWCSVAPRREFAGLQTSRFAKPIDEKDAWAISCLYVDKAHRGSGLASALVRAAVEHALARGAECVDAWPNEPRAHMVDVFAWMGLRPCFDRAGFVEVARNTPARPYMRVELARSRRRRS